MKTMSKKLASIVLALCLCFSLVGTALAAEIQTYSSSTDEEFTITVTKAADGETYTAYKIFDVTYSDPDTDGNVSYSYTIDADSAWYSIVAAATDVFTLTQVGSTSTYVVTVKDDVEDDTVIAVFTSAGVPAGAVEATSTTASGGQAVLDVTDSGPGYYYVTTSLGSLVMIDTTNPDPEIEEKNGIPTVSKYVHENTVTSEDDDNYWGPEDDASNAEMILFEIEIDNINGAVNLVLHDSMDDELEIPDTTNFHMNSVVLYTSENAEGITLTEGVDYTITVGECTVTTCTLDNCAFEIHFLRSFDDVDATGYIELTYELLLDTEGDAYEGDYEEIDNFAQVTFANTSYSTPVQAETYSFGFETYKYDGDSNEPLQGVEFELKNSSGATAYFETETVDGQTIYLFEGWGTPAEGSDYTQTLVTGSDGMIYIDGLDQGVYTLTETKPLDGYTSLTGDVTVTITATYNEETGAIESHTVTYTYGDETGTGIVYIENSTGSILPGTGGMGTTIFYIIGGVLVAGAVVVLITRRRMSSNEG